MTATDTPPRAGPGRRRWVTVVLIGALLAAALPALAAMAGTPELAAVLLVEQLAFGWAWVAVLRASRPTVLLLAAAALAADGAVLGATRHELGSTAGVVGAGLAVVIGYQLFRRRRAAPAPGAAGALGGPARARVTAELAAALGGGTLVAFLAGLLALRAQPGAPAPGELLVAVGLVGAGGAVLVTWLGGLLGAGPLLAGGLAIAAGTGLGAGYGGLAADVSAPAAAVLAAAGALAAAVMGVLIARAGSGLASSCAAAGQPEAGVSEAGVSGAGVSGERPAAAPDEVRERSIEAPARAARRGPADGLTGRWAPAAAGGVRVWPFGAMPIASALLVAVAPLTVAAPLVYLVGRHLPG